MPRRSRVLPLSVAVDREDDGRWLAEVPAVAGAMAYGATRAEAVGRVQAVALRAPADRMEHGEPTPEAAGVSAVSP